LNLLSIKNHPFALMSAFTGRTRQARENSRE
jgi:hypothetical protein